MDARASIEGGTLERHRERVAELFPQLSLASFEPIGRGWDCFTYRVDDEWIVQLPRLPIAERTLERQLRLLPELAREVSGAVPVPELVSFDPPVMGYRAIEGVSVAEAPVPDAGILPERLGRFLYDLHIVPLEFLGLRGPVAPVWRERLEADLDDFRQRVVPLLDRGDALDAGEAGRADARFGAYLDDDRHFRFPDSFVHQDLGPEHVLMTPSGDLAGVIDWGDAGPGDPAIDFGWILQHAPEIGERALAAYGGAPDETFLARAAFYDAIGPWHDVTYGLDNDLPAFVERGLAGLRDRLPA
jgi:aminoglycoside phosphotransferase (APT) family kinase protein